LKIFEMRLHGIFHTSGSERISRLDFAYKIAKKFALPKELITPITSTELNQIAKRPSDSSLDVAATEKKLKFKLYTVDEGLRAMRREAL